MVLRFCFALCALCALRLSAADLRIVAPAIQTAQAGANIGPADSFVPGETVYFSFRVESFTRRGDDVHLLYSSTCSDPSGTALAPPANGEVKVTLAPEDKGWTPVIRQQCLLPPVLFGGEYRIAFRVTDDASKAETSGELKFKVRGPQPPSGKDLAVEGIEFFSANHEEKPLNPAVFRAGEPIVAHFRISGFGHRPSGSIDVTYGIRLAAESGQVLFDEPAAAKDQTNDAYPKAWVPGIATLSLKPGTPAGGFVLTVSAWDGVNLRRTESKASFRLE